MLTVTDNIRHLPHPIRVIMWTFKLCKSKCVIQHNGAEYSKEKYYKYYYEIIFKIKFGYFEKNFNYFKF